MQPWTLTHSMFEISDKMETVEIVKPTNDAAGNFSGISHETVFYDSDAFVAPVRATCSFAAWRRRRIPSAGSPSWSA